MAAANIGIRLVKVVLIITMLIAFSPLAAAGFHDISNNCTVCHNTDVSIEHEIYYPYPYNCRICHPTILPILPSTDCMNYCHNEGSDIVAPEHIVVGKHDTSKIEKHNSTSECTVCHNGIDPYVIDISPIHNDNCSVCHKNPLVDLSLVINAECKDCHLDQGIGYGKHSEFDPGISNSYHPAMMIGTNNFIGYESSLINGWTPTNITKCDDCHSQGGELNYSKPDDPLQTFTQPSNDVCFDCHDLTKGTGFKSTGNVNRHTTHHDNFGCAACHNVHGSDWGRLQNETLYISWVQHTGDYRKEDCDTSCHSGSGKGGGGTTIVEPAVVKGRVTDNSTGAGIKWAKISTDKFDVNFYTNDTGYYEFPNLYPTSYTFTVSKSGYTNATDTQSFSAGQIVTLNFVLE